jgi:Bacteriophage HK97-gp10, putative tail-component
VATIIDPIMVQGLSEFRRNLRAMDQGLPRALRLAGNEAANIVVDSARPTVPHKTGKAAQSIKARSSQTATRVVAGGSRAPYFPWLDYGGAVGVNNTAKRKWEPDGRYVYPAYRREKVRVEETLNAALRRIAEDSGVELG